MSRLRSIALILLLTVSGSSCVSRESNSDEFTPDQIEALARCLTEKGWVMYGTSTCSGCRAQRKGFGKAWAHINYVECDPHEPDNDVDRCLERKIRKTPSWILEVDGKEVKRVELYQLLEYLVELSACDV